jgi:hypothetical protein
MVVESFLKIWMVVQTFAVYLMGALPYHEYYLMSSHHTSTKLTLHYDLTPLTSVYP